MKSIKKALNLIRNVMPKNINFKKIYFSAVIYTICELAILFVFSYIGIDIAFKKESIPLFIIVVSIVCFIQLTSNITYMIAFKNGNKMTKDINIEVRRKLFKKVMDLDKEYHNNHPTGATMNTVIGDVEMISEGFFWPSLYIVIQSVNIIVCFIICLFINYKLSMILVLSAIPVYFLSSYFLKRGAKIDDKRREIRKRKLSHINDSVMGIRTIKTLNLEKKSYQEYKAINKENYKYNLKREYNYQYLWRLIEIISNIAIAALFYFSYKEYISLSISYGSIYLFFTLFDKCIYSVGGLANNIDSIEEVLLSAEKVEKLLNKEPMIKDRENINLNPEKLKGEIEFKNVTFKYPKGEQVLTDFNLKINPKTKVALVGRTGSGKSTIASLIYRFYEPTAGEILFDGKDYLELPQAFIRKNIGFILQDALLFDDTIINNIRYGKREASLEEVKEVCKKIGLDEFVEKMENKYDTRVGEGGLMLSNGQKQLIAFARVLLTNPDIIILDEATSSIDSLYEQLIQNCINVHFKDKTCIFIAHRLSTIKDVDNIIYIDKGKIIEEGNHISLMNKKGKYYNLYMSQFYNKLLNEQLGMEVNYGQ